MYWYFDSTYILVIAGFLICMICSVSMNSTFSTYSRIRSVSGYTGRETAQRILYDSGIYDVRIGKIRGSLTDHYNPGTKELNLSESVCDLSSIAAIGVAAHECGHAIQHEKGYLPLQIRTAIVPAVNVCSQLSWLLIIIGLCFTGFSSYSGRMGYSGISSMILNIGIIMFSVTVLFQFVTLPVEINASRRALAMLRTTGILNEEELNGAKKVLTAAALTYVASTISAILSLLRIILISNNRRR